MAKIKARTVPLMTTVSVATMDRIDYIKRSEEYRYINQVIETLILEKYNELIERNQNRAAIKQANKKAK